jgi:RNA polymerase sigma-70 factor (ECF subfamily)
VADVAAPLAETLTDVGPEQLQSALNELPEEFRTPVILCYLEEFSYRDIAAQMGVPIGTVMSRISRGKAHLRAKLQPPAELSSKKEVFSGSPRSYLRQA